MNIKPLHQACRHESSISRITLLSLFACLLMALPLSAQTAEEGEVEELSPFELEEVHTSGYGSSYAMGATRIATPVLDTSLSVISLNEELIEDMGTVDQTDVLKYVSGTGQVSSSPSLGRISIRGFSVSSNQVDGVRASLPGGGIQPAYDPVLFQNYEVIKGLAGVLYGTQSLGGVVNRNSKKALSVPRTELAFQYGDIGDTVRITADSTGPLNEEGTFRYRFMGAFQNGDFKNGGANNRAVAGLRLEYDIDESTTVWINSNFHDIDNAHSQFGWTYDGDGNPSDFLPVDFRMGPERATN